MTKPQFIIAAPTSNAGKTTVTLGLLRALKNRRLSPQSFKCGPDYIDPKFHEVACDQLGINLDLFMMSESHVQETYDNYSATAGAVCVEGVMGLFDGAKRSEGSTAEIAKFLNLPVVLVVDAKAVAYSVAPLLYGFKNFDPSVQIAGVIFNRVNTKSHYQFLVEACEDVGIEPLGHLPFMADCEIPSRHLGLSIDQMMQYDTIIEQFAVQIEKTVNVDKLLASCHSDSPSPTPTKRLVSGGLKIAVASDEGFNFTYHQNIAALKRIGTIELFSPIHDSSLPEADLVYFPGGYPELHLEALSQNSSMLQCIKTYGASGGAIIAECGGLMYLGQSIENKEDKIFNMVGLFDFKTSMKTMKLSLGYRQIIQDAAALKGHEFHYSTLSNDEQTQHTGCIKNARDKVVKTKCYRYQNVWASYVHLYFGDDEDLLKLLNLMNLNHQSTFKNHKI